MKIAHRLRINLQANPNFRGNPKGPASKKTARKSGNRGNK